MPSEEAEPSGPQPVRVNEVTFDELRGLGMSVTQANRVIAYRDRMGGFDSLDDIDRVPGFPPGLLDDVKKQLED